MIPLRIAVVGPGLIGARHIQLIDEHPRARLAAIVAPDRSHHHSRAHAHTVRLFHEVGEMLRAEVPDGVVIASPNAIHEQHAMECLRARTPVLVEKPLCTTYASALSLAEAGAQLGVPILVGHHRAHSPLMRKAREVIASGALGRLVTISGSATFLKPDDYFEAGPWRREPGGGPIQINLIHEIGNLRALCGEVAAVHAIATSQNRRFAVEDTAVLSLVFANGVLGTFVLSDTAASARSWELTSRENSAYPAYDDEDCYVISGTLGSLAVPSMRLKLYKNKESASWWTPLSESQLVVERQDPLKLQLQNFIAVIQGEEGPWVSAFDGAENVRVIDAVFESIRLGRTVRLERGPDHDFPTARAAV